MPAGRRAGPGENAAGQHRRADHGPEFQADPVHPRPDARRHHRNRHSPGRSGDRPAEVHLPARSAVRAHDPGGRNQPDAAQDPGRPARGDAGTPRDRWRHDLSPAQAVLRARHAKPDRAGGHLSASRGATRPLHVQHQGRVPVAGRRDSDHEEHHLESETGPRTDPHGRAVDPPAGHRASGGGGRPCLRVCRRPGAGDPPEGTGRPEMGFGSGGVGRRPAGEPVPDPRRQGQGGAARPPSPCCGTA